MADDVKTLTDLTQDVIYDPAWLVRILSIIVHRNGGAMAVSQQENDAIDVLGINIALTSNNMVLLRTSVPDPLALAETKGSA